MSNLRILDRLRGRFGWPDHAVSAYRRFDSRGDNFFAAGLSYSLPDENPTPRISIHVTPSDALAFREGAAKRSQGHV